MAFSLKSIGQDLQLKRGDFAYGLALGINYANVVRQMELKTNPLPRPFMGISTSYLLSNKWRMNGDFLFSMRASLIDNKYVIEKQGFDFNYTFQYSVDDIYFHIGIVSQFDINQNLRSKSNSITEEQLEFEELNLESYSLNPIIGFEMKLMDNWTLKANYIPPLIDPNTSNFQMGLSYRINKNSVKKETDRRRKRRIAERQIKELRNGALLVRLKTSQPKIDALRKVKSIQLAEETIKKQRVENLSLMNSFNNYYNFSEVKYYYSEDSRKIKEGNFEGVFLNDSLEKDSTIIIYNPENIFIAELAKIEQDTAMYFSHYETVSTGNFAQMQVPRFYGGTDISFYAIVIKDQEYNQLSKPFPYYSRALFKGMSDNPGHGIFYLPLKFFFPSTPKGTLEQLNEKLHRFYNKTVY